MAAPRTQRRARERDPLVVELERSPWDQEPPVLPELTLEIPSWPGERVEALDARPLRGATPRTLERSRQALTSAMSSRRALPMRVLVALPDDEVRLWLERVAPLLGDTPEDADALAGLVARIGIAILPGLVAYGLAHPAAAAPLVVRARSPRVAPVIARLMMESATRTSAELWLLEDGAMAALGLWPTALGAGVPLREAARRALRFMVAWGREAQVREAARAYDVEPHLAPLLAADLPPRPVRAAWPSLAVLPMPRTRTGTPIGKRALRNVIDLLRATGRRPPLHALRAVRAAIHPPDLAALGLCLYDRQRSDRDGAGQAWAVHAVGLVGGDAAIEGLFSRLATAPYDYSDRPRYAVEAVAAIASPLALIELETSIGHSVHARHARAALFDLRVRRGGPPYAEGPEHLPDPLEDGGAEIGLRVRATLDDALALRLVDADGIAIEALPEGGDALAHEVAVARLKHLERATSLVAPALVRRFERAMIQGRPLAPNALAAILARPSLRAVTCGLVLELALPDGPPLLVHVAEDGTLETLAGDRIAPTPDMRVRIPHPIELPPPLLARWAEHLAESKLAQPFEQLGRAIADRVPEVRALAVLGAALTRLETQGWSRQLIGGWALELDLPIRARLESTTNVPPEIPPEQRFVVTLRIEPAMMPKTPIGVAELARALAPLFE